MKNRKRMNPRKDRKMFSRHASKQHKKNLPSRPMRGGIRL